MDAFAQLDHYWAIDTPESSEITPKAIQKLWRRIPLVGQIESLEAVVRVVEVREKVTVTS